MKISPKLIKKNTLIPLFENGKIKYSYEPEFFNKEYKIKIISPDLSEYSKRELKGNGQEHKSYCGISSIDNYLFDKYNISFDSEINIMKLCEDIYIAKKFIHNEGISPNYEILEHGSKMIHLTNLTSFFDLRYFSGNGGTIETIKELLDQDFPVIIYRPYTKKDREGHFLLVYGIDKMQKTLSLFDPSYRGKREEEFENHNGTHKNETYERFIERWPMDLKPEHKMRQNNFYAFISEKRDGPEGKFHGKYYY